MIAPGYLRVEAFKCTLGDERGFSSDDDYQRAINAASRWIDDYCQRHFWLCAQPVSRLVRPTSRAVLRAGDFSTTEDMTVEVDLLGNGTFTVLDAAAWQAEPFDPLDGWPYERITPTSSISWPVDAQRPRVRVTARWGWPAVPPQVEQACLILAVAYGKAKDITGARTGFERYEDDPMSPLGVVRHLLAEFAPIRDESRSP